MACGIRSQALPPGDRSRGGHAAIETRVIRGRFDDFHMNLSERLRELSTRSPQQWLEGTSRGLPYAVSGIFVLAIAWQLTQLTWLLLGSQSALEPAVVAISPGAPGSGQRAVDLQAIVNAHLFGVPSAEQPQTSAADAPRTQMNLVLAGTMAAEDPREGLAIIGETSANSKVYTVGQTIRSGTKLHAVYVDRVILDRGGRLEALLLPKESRGGTASNAQAPRLPPTMSAQPSVAENVRRLAQQNPGALTEILRPQPVFANGVQRGYRVYPGRNRQQFARLGLQPGDLVMAINGTPLDDPARGMEIFNSLGSASSVNVTIERNGQTEELTLNVAQMSLPDGGAGAPSDSASE